MCNLYVRHPVTSGSPVFGPGVLTDTTGCPQRGCSLLSLGTSGRLATGAFRRVCTFGTRDTGGRRLASTAALTTALVTLVPAITAGVGRAATSTTIAPSIT